MSYLARMFLALYSALLIAACAGLIALSFNDEEMLDLDIGDYTVQAVVESSDGARLAVTVILGAVALIGAITLVIAFLPWRGRHGPGVVRIQRAGGGSVEITTAALEQLLHEEIQSLPGVRQASPTVRVRGDTIEPEIAIAIDPGANIAEVTSTVSEATGAVLREQLGATQVRRPVIKITYDELEVRHPPVRPVAPPEGPLPPPPGTPARGNAETESTERLAWQAPADATAGRTEPPPETVGEAAPAEEQAPGEAANEAKPEDESPRTDA